MRDFTLIACLALLGLVVSKLLLVHLFGLEIVFLVGRLLLYRRLNGNLLCRCFLLSGFGHDGSEDSRTLFPTLFKPYNSGVAYRAGERH